MTICSIYLGGISPHALLLSPIAPGTSKDNLIIFKHRVLLSVGNPTHLYVYY